MKRKFGAILMMPLICLLLVGIIYEATKAPIEALIAYGIIALFVVGIWLAVRG